MKNLALVLLIILACSSTGISLSPPMKVPSADHFDCAGIDDLWHIATVLELTGKRLHFEVKSELGRWMAHKISNWGKGLKVRIEEFDLKNSCSDA